MPTYAIVYGIWRFLIEFARSDERGETIISALSPSQLIAILMIAAGVLYICVWYFKKKKSASFNAVENIERNEDTGNGKNGSDQAV